MKLDIIDWMSPILFLLLPRLLFSVIVEQIFREANVSLNGHVKYEDFVKIACAPVPDYY